MLVDALEDVATEMEVEAYLLVEKSIKGDVSEKAWTAVPASSAETIENRIVDGRLCLAARWACRRWIDVASLMTTGAELQQPDESGELWQIQIVTGAGSLFPASCCRCRGR